MTRIRHLLTQHERENVVPALPAAIGQCIYYGLRTHHILHRLSGRDYPLTNVLVRDDSKWYTLGRRRRSAPETPLAFLTLVLEDAVGPIKTAKLCDKLIAAAALHAENIFYSAGITIDYQRGQGTALILDRDQVLKEVFLLAGLSAREQMTYVQHEAATLHESLCRRDVPYFSENTNDEEDDT